MIVRCKALMRRAAATAVASSRAQPRGRVSAAAAQPVESLWESSAPSYYSISEVPELTDIESEALHARIGQLVRLYDSLGDAGGTKDLHSVPMHLMKDKNTRERFDLYLRYQQGQQLVAGLRASLVDDTFAQGDTRSSELPVKLREVAKAVTSFLEDKCQGQVFAHRNLRHLADLRKLETKTPSFPRVIHFHEGPTNSGKTYSAMQALRKAERGVYCGPLRLLAWQCYEDLLAMGLDADLLTGQEHIRGQQSEASETEPVRATEDSEAGVGSHLSCTVEMSPGPGSVEYDIGVIDEVQLVGDRERGGAWTRAILALPAREIHLCGDGRATGLVEALLGQYRPNDIVLRHKPYSRLSPLFLSGKAIGSYRSLRRGDCVVVFSRWDIMRVKADIERSTRWRVCVVYGTLPPETRRDQINSFNRQEFDVLVATDCIGLGLNFNIRRVIFSTVHKFDGVETRQLVPTEFRQIGGRAGRYGLAAGAEGGVVACMHEDQLAPLFQGFGLEWSKDIFELEVPAHLMVTDEVTQAAILPESSVLNAFSAEAEAALGQRDVPAAKIFQTFAEVAHTDPICYLGTWSARMVNIAKGLSDIEGLTFQQIVEFCSSPADPNDPIVLSGLRTFAQSLVATRQVPLPESLVFDAEVPTTVSAVFHLERVCQIYDLYLWLARRSSSQVYTSETEVREIRTKVVEAITRAIRGQLDIDSTEDVAAQVAEKLMDDDLPGSRRKFKSIELGAVTEFVKSRGLAGELKSLLRTRLVQEFRRRQRNGDEVKANDHSLRTKAMISLIGDYLKQTKKDLSLSVILPDYGLTSSDLLTGEDIIQALGLQEVPLATDEQSPVLASIVDAIKQAASRPRNHMVPPGTAAASVQTEPPEPSQTLEDKLRALENAAASMSSANDNDRHVRLEERMIRYKRECDRRVKEEVEAQVERIRSIELPNARLEAAAQLRTELRAAREDLEREAKEREAKFRIQEQRTVDRLRMKEAELDRRAISTKESLLRELENERIAVREKARALAARESELGQLERRIEAMKREVQEREDKLRTCFMGGVGLYTESPDLIDQVARLAQSVEREALNLVVVELATLKLRAEMEAERRSLVDKQNEIDRMRACLDSEQVRLQSVHTTHMSTGQQLMTVEKERDSLAAQVEQLQESLQEARRQSRVLEATIETDRRANERIDHELTITKRRLEEVKEQHAEIDKLRKRETELERREISAKDRLLRELESERESFKEKLKSQNNVVVTAREAEMQGKALEIKHQVDSVAALRDKLAVDKQKEVEAACSRMRAEVEVEKRQAREALAEAEREKAKLQAWKARLQSVQAAQLEANQHLALAEEERQLLLDKIDELELQLRVEKAKGLPGRASSSEKGAPGWSHVSIRKSPTQTAGSSPASSQQSNHPDNREIGGHSSTELHWTAAPSSSSSHERKDDHTYEQEIARPTKSSPSSTGSFQIVGSLREEDKIANSRVGNESHQIDFTIPPTKTVQVDPPIADSARSIEGSVVPKKSDGPAPGVSSGQDILEAVDMKEQHIRIAASPPGEASLESIGLSSSASHSHINDGGIQDGSAELTSERGPSPSSGVAAGSGLTNDMPRQVAEENPDGWDSDEFASHQDSEVVDSDW
ncbi:hypothetical protein FOL47_003309 [Perkinsus chesapeaki]|uniref:Helicase C-terminal domain-containing protein n=1 Tax=Perkinsus chesapeaki TaxID=330153 RepID=A0A7J6N237_PERCH|nr:hypothetical protein FOL47_003309 [Perkinsus chesapeaki]